MLYCIAYHHNSDIALYCLILRSELYYTLSLDCIVLMEKLEFRSEIHWRGFDYISDTISQIQRSNLIPTGTVQFYTEGYMNVWMCECVWKDTSTYILKKCQWRGWSTYISAATFSDKQSFIRKHYQLCNHIIWYDTNLD